MPISATATPILPNCWTTSNQYSPSRGRSADSSTPMIIVLRQSLFVTSNQNVCRASARLSGGTRLVYMLRKFHAY